MSDPLTHDVTQLLHRLADDKHEAENELVQLIYSELKRIAVAMMRTERPDHTLAPTAVVHEAFLRLRPNLASMANRRHLLAAARRAMRRVLIDHARAHRAQKRTPPEATTPQAELLFQPWHLELAEALEDLAQLDPRQREIVEYRYFLGLTVNEVADQLELSTSQIEKDWRSARAWLYRRLGADQWKKNTGAG